MLHAENVQRRDVRADVFVAVAAPEHAQYGAAVAEHVRDHTSLRVLQHAAGGLRSQLREADRAGARWAVIVGDDEVAENRVSLKWLRADRPQSTVDMDALVTEFKQDCHAR